MRNSLLIAALVVSALFNGAFVFGYLWSGRASSTPIAENHVVERVSRALNLTDEQRTAFSELHDQQREELDDLNDQLSLARQQIREELGQEEPSQDRLGELAAMQADLEHQRRVAAADRFSAFMQSLAPEQREKFAEPLPPPPWERRPGREREHRRFMERFDENNDGEIDKQEREKAEQAMRDRWHRRGEGRRGRGSDEGERDGESHSGEFAGRRRSPPEDLMRRALLERFDADDNGELDAGEQQQLIEWLAQPIQPRSPEGDQDEADSG